MEIWSGSISLNNKRDPTGEVLEDVRLYNPQLSSSLSAEANVTLGFLSFVDIACIPLNAFLGPALDVYTINESTEAWFREHLLIGIEHHATHDGHLEEEVQWWTRGRTQSELGVLVKVNGDLKVHRYGSKVTELLLYACTTLVSGQNQGALPTPPRSSSTNPGQEGFYEAKQGEGCVARLCARLISSDLCRQASQCGTDSRKLSQYPALDPPRFLTPPPDELPTEEHLLQKRQRLESLFDDAERLNKKSRSRGGETVAKLMASNHNASISLHREQDGQSLGGEDGAKVSNILPPSGRPRQGKAPGLSRSQSLGSLKNLDDVRPRSRHGNVSTQKRASLNRVASFAAIESSSPVTEASDGLEQQNKNALTRVVMAGMRMYGFQPKRRPTLSRAATEDSPQPLTSDVVAGDEDEYKNMYHQTLKAASFSLRNHMAKEIISQQIMRDVVDRQLALFCNDPLQADQNKEGFASGFTSEKPTEI